MQNISKRLILVVAVLIIAIVAGGWFWYARQKMTASLMEGEIKTIYTFPGQNVPDDQSPETQVSKGNEPDNIKALISNDSPIDSVNTSDWKTYRNEAMGFEIKYPKNFTLDTKKTETGHLVSFMEYDKNAKDLSGKSIPGYYAQATIYHWTDINDESLRDGSRWGEKSPYNSLQEFVADEKNTAIKNLGEVNLDGVLAYDLSMPGEMGYEALMFEYNHGYYQISFPPTQKSLAKEIKKSIVLSLKFLKQ